MDPQPISERARPSLKFTGRMTLITGGNSGIGRAVAYAFVKEESKVVIAYYDEDRDAQETVGRISPPKGRGFHHQYHLRYRLSGA